MSVILVVDDSAADRRLVGGILEKNSDYSVRFAKNGTEALVLMDQSRPDLVLTDMMMPEMDGLELVSTVRRRFPFVPTVLMTSRGSEDVAVKALQRGAASYVPKRELAQDLLRTLGDVLERTGRLRTQQRLMESLDSCRLHFILGNQRSMLSTLVSHLQELATHLGVSDESDRVRIGIALEEALVNAFYHGNLEVSSDLRETDYEAYQTLLDTRTHQEPYSLRKIHVEAKLSRERAEFVIRDEGQGFNPNDLPDPTDPANLEKVSGRGVLLMRTFMDEVTYNERGNEVTLVKFRSLPDEELKVEEDDD